MSTSLRATNLRPPEQIATLLVVMEIRVRKSALMTPAPRSTSRIRMRWKVVIDLAASRSIFPELRFRFYRAGSGPGYFKHLGSYAYPGCAGPLVTLPDHRWKRAERLEQLSSSGEWHSDLVGETPYDSVGVDTEEDLQRVIEMLRNASGLQSCGCGRARDSKLRPLHTPRDRRIENGRTIPRSWKRPLCEILLCQLIHRGDERLNAGDRLERNRSACRSLNRE